VKKRLPFLLLVLAVAIPVQGQIIFDKETLEYHATLLDEQWEAVYRFTNIGETTVTISKVTTSCGCTVATMDKNLYRPGESGEIKALFTFGTRTGTQRKRISVETTGVVRKSHSLVMVSHIPKWFEMEPNILRWKSTEPLASKELTITVTDPDLIQLTAPGQLESFDLEIRENGGGIYVFTATPHNLRKGITESISLDAVVSADGKVRKQPIHVFCLVR
jgi:hypothetical protein